MLFMNFSCHFMEVFVFKDIGHLKGSFVFLCFFGFFFSGCKVRYRNFTKLESARKVICEVDFER